MKRIISIAFITLTLCIMALSVVILASCSKDEDSTEPSAESLCSIVKARYGDVSIQIPDCTSPTGGWSNVVLSETNQLISFNFNISCGGKTYSGKVYNIVYEPDGDVRSYDATVNGHNCHGGQ
jgi:hypothetical protein